MNLPTGFTERMEALLGDEYPSFLQCYEQEKKQGLRVNTNKISVEDFLKMTPFSLEPIPWTENGFYYKDEDKVTRHPHYYAGLYYIQEPSAMVPASRLPIEAGDRVLDLCAAPGGKATELGAKLKGTGVLVANDISVSRARGLLKNLELFGISNCFVTGESPEKLKTVFSGFFDKILVDAPCSGEGMFRKDPGLVKSWLERGPEYYAPLQKQILSAALSMLRPGGMLLYSTCTFSPEEDEAVIMDALRKDPTLSMVEPLQYEGFSQGFSPSALQENFQSATQENLQSELKGNSQSASQENSYNDVTGTEQLPVMADRFEPEKCIRIWPQKMEGEGHFAVLLKKKENTNDTGSRCLEAGQTDEKKNVQKAVTQKSSMHHNDSTQQFSELSGKTKLPFHRQMSEFLKHMTGSRWSTCQVQINQEDIYLYPEDFSVPRLRYLRSGLFFGTGKKERFEPSQALAMALRKEEFDNVLDLPSEHPAVLRYLKGETLDLPEAENCQSGWVLICCDGYPLGWGKNVNGTIRNKYSAGWRML